MFESDNILVCYAFVVLAVWVRLHVPLFRLFDGHSVLFLLALVGVTES